jgi:hypothetical protein
LQKATKWCRIYHELAPEDIPFVTKRGGDKGQESGGAGEQGREGEEGLGEKNQANG